MLRANIYSLEPLDKEFREEVHLGIEMVAAYIGHSAVSKACLIKAPTNSVGQVDPHRANFSKLDKLVELHIMALPLMQYSHDINLGIAGLGRGWAFVDPTKAQSGLSVRSTTAHEVGHALGFVRETASHIDNQSHYHCADRNCIMHAYQTLTPIPEWHIRQPGAVRKTAGKIATSLFVRPEPQIPFADSQFDFCLDCKVDLRNQGERNLGILRANRLSYGSRIK